MSAYALSPNLEDYLEAILQISSMNKVARSMEIASRLNVKRSSVTVALRSLAEKGLINYEVRSFVTLTDKGLDAAKCIDRRHHILLDFFISILGLSYEEANKTACSMEHGMTSDVCRRMAAFLVAAKKDETGSTKIKQLLEQSLSEIDCITNCGFISHQNNAEGLVSLNDLLPGQKGIILQVNGTGKLKKRLLEMGIVKGQSITVMRAAPLDDPIEVKVKNSSLTLRREEASNILLKRC